MRRANPHRAEASFVVGGETLLRLVGQRLRTAEQMPQGMAHDAAKWHADQFSDTVMAEHPVAEEPAARV